MDEMKTIYIILATLRKALDGELDTEDLSGATLGITDKKRRGAKAGQNTNRRTGN